jgi:hypothetical protein
MSRIYSSEFDRNKAENRAWRVKLILASLAAGLAMIAVQRFDRMDFDRAVDASLKYLAENTDYRSYVLTEEHCRAPRAGERLVMELAKPREPGKGYRCTYWQNVGYGLAPQMAELTYSRGLKP